MECNKDEAIRAKEIAEKKLAAKDFAGAKKFTLKAKTLYPGLDGISQMLTTLDVYISAENKVSGEVDWYGILGVNPSDDDETIRRQYRKLALTLHPDKNKSVGADGAFKLLSEAWSLLSDKAKRSAYNQRRTSGSHQRVPSQSGGPSAAPGVNGFYSSAKRATSKPKTERRTAANWMGTGSVRPPAPGPGPAPSPAPAPPPVSVRNDTFWTICHRCKMHYEYVKEFLNQTLSCPNCRKPFLAKEMPPPASYSKSTHASAHQRHQNSSNLAPNSKPNTTQYDPGRSAATTQNVSSSNNTNVQWGLFSGTNDTDPSIASKAANVVQQVHDRLKRGREELYAGCSSKTRKVDDGVKIPYQMSMGNCGVSAGNAFGFRYTGFETDRTYGFPGMNRKSNSTRELTPLEARNLLLQKAKREICRKMSECHSKEGKLEENKEDRKKQFTKTVSDNANGNHASSAKKNGGQTADEQSPQESAMNVPDADFHDFDMDRTEHSFEDNQVWSAYDDDDGMPRFYCLIHKVISRKPLKMKISWLNSKTTTEFGSMDWIGSGFQKTCGEFRVGRHEINKSLNSFSQKVEWIKGPRGTVLILPRKGEVWALYRNWSCDWNAHIPDDVIHKYDMVEVLDDYNEEQGVPVSPLVKFSGYRTVFHPRTEQSEVKRIPKEEMFRFSHQVPKYLLTGEEAHNAPKGCLELDPAATPLELIQGSTDANEALRAEEDATKA